MIEDFLRILESTIELQASELAEMPDDEKEIIVSEGKYNALKGCGDPRVSIDKGDVYFNGIKLRIANR